LICKPRWMGFYTFEGFGTLLMRTCVVVLFCVVFFGLKVVSPTDEHMLARWGGLSQIAHVLPREQKWTFDENVQKSIIVPSAKRVAKETRLNKNTQSAPRPGKGTTYLHSTPALPMCNSPSLKLASHVGICSDM